MHYYLKAFFRFLVGAALQRVRFFWLFFRDVLFCLTIPSLTISCCWAATSLLASLYSDLLSDVHILNVDVQVVKTQLRRATTVKDYDIAILGDSSALMGIDPHILEDNLGKRIESFATIGYLGPQGYAYMLDHLAQDKARIDRVVLVMHPIQFHRDQSCEMWIPLIKRLNEPVEISQQADPKDLIRNFTNRFLVYAPLPGHYGVYYGSPNAFISTIEACKGSAIDPYSGLQYDNIDDLHHALDTGFAKLDSNLFTLTDLYRQALVYLDKSIAKFGRDKVILLLGPLPLGLDNVNARQTILASFHEVAEALSIPPDRVIVPKLAFSMDGKYFSSSTHLNRFGKSFYSNSLSKDLHSLGAKKT